MSSVDEKMTALADAIREKANTSGKMTIDEMTVTVRGISVGEGDATVQTTKSATISTPSGTISPDSGFDSMSSVKYNVDVDSILDAAGYEPPTESIIITSAESKIYTPSEGKVGFELVDVCINKEKATAVPSKEMQMITPTDKNAVLAAVTVAPIPDNYIDPVGTKLIEENGTEIDVRGYNAVTVRVPENTGEVCQHQEVLTITSPENKVYYPGQHYEAISRVEVEIPEETVTVTPSRVAQVITPPTGTKLTRVTVNPIPADYDDTGNVPPMATAQLLIIGTPSMTGDEVLIPYYENGELKHCYGYEVLSAHLNDGYAVFNVPVGAMVGLKGISYSKVLGTFEDVSHYFNVMANGIEWHIMSDDTELSLN